MRDIDGYKERMKLTFVFLVDFGDEKEAVKRIGILFDLAFYGLIKNSDYEELKEYYESYKKRKEGKQ